MSRRQQIGIVALLLLAVGAGGWVAGTEPASAAAFFRVGLILAMIWVAYPDLRRVPAWLIPGGFAAVVLIAWRPKLGMLIIPPVLLVLWLARMSKK